MFKKRRKAMIFLYSVCAKRDRKSLKGHSLVVFLLFKDFAKKQGVTKNLIEKLFQACILLTVQKLCEHILSTKQTFGQVDIKLKKARIMSFFIKTGTYFKLTTALI